MKSITFTIYNKSGIFGSEGRSLMQQPATLTKRELETFSLLQRLVDTDGLCPKKVHLQTLVDNGLIRIEAFRERSGTQKCRVVTILQGTQAGKQTNRPAWIKPNLKPFQVYDSRPTATIHTLGLLAPRDALGNTATNDRVTPLAHPFGSSES